MKRFSILITGASSGIGQALASHFAQHNWQVFAGVRKQTDYDALNRNKYKNITPVFMDVTNKESVLEAVGIVKNQTTGALNALINNAGIAIAGPLELLSTADFKHQFNVNVFGVIETTNACLPLLKASEGRIINISSVSGVQSFPGLSAYCSSKFALEAISDAQRLELKPYNIKVSVIQPGPIKTSIWHKGQQQAKDLLENHQHSGASGLDTSVLLMSKVKTLASQSEEKGLPVSSVVNTVWKAVTANNPKARYTVGPNACIGKLLAYLPDQWLDTLKQARLNSLKP